MALHARLRLKPQYSNFKAISAAPGGSATHLNVPVPKVLRSTVLMSPPDGSCSLLMAMFHPSATSGDFFEPNLVIYGRPAKIISDGVPVSLAQPLRLLMGINDATLCDHATLVDVWNFSERGLGERFDI
eukprot:gnl/TRDRNA2_/TRDRNA2_132183_c1_seq1.p1 gnl/TRDRNA2_/TRDRNA2_132183_c1~~gnl/TRDRNA2_/TRDRNA2_132183_c1_seq1.p1  ORF type:complete len:129 (-),score=8.10 gnl/TRDRNA2_/TRDRNA2_132183_c1_seq1:133-519(-)